MANPPRKSYKSKRRNYRRKRNKKSKRSSIPTAPRNHSIVKLRYTENIRLDSIFGSQATQLYRINDLFDPNFSGIGHQPYFRDQMYALYRYGRVLWAKISVMLMTNNAQTPCYFIIAPCQGGIMDANFETSSERKGSKECYINGQIRKTLTCKASSDYYFGHKKGTTSSDTVYLQNSASSLASVNAMWYGLGFISLDSSISGVSVYVKVDIEQIVRFEEPQQQTGS